MEVLGELKKIKKILELTDIDASLIQRCKNILRIKKEDILSEIVAFENLKKHINLELESHASSHRTSLVERELEISASHIESEIQARMDIINIIF